MKPDVLECLNERLLSLKELTALVLSLIDAALDEVSEAMGEPPAVGPEGQQLTEKDNERR